MSTIITYTDEFFQPVSGDMARSLNVYREIINENNIDTKVNLYRDGKLKGTLYYVLSLEDIPELLSKDPGGSFCLEEKINGYNSSEDLFYDNGNLTLHKKYISDGDDLICEIEYDRVSGKPTWTEKQYYDDAGEVEIRFYYSNETGCFSYLNFVQDDYIKSFQERDFGTRIQFNWDKVGDYYRHAEPLIPVATSPTQSS